MEIITGTVESAKGFQSLYQLTALFIVCAGGIAAFWLHLYTKRMVTKGCEAEQARTAQRKAERDKEVAELRSEIKNAGDKADSVSASFDKHIEHHKDIDSRAQRTYDTIDGRLRKIEDNLIERIKFDRLQSDVHDMDKRVIEIYTILKERLK